MRSKDLELYVHIPFCVKKCAYCDFLSAPADMQERTLYINALTAEIREKKEEFRGRQVCSVFLGGGTPSILDTDETGKIFRALYASFDIGAGAEITVEVNPGTVTEKKAEMWKKCGVNRLSIGLQSANDDELAMLGRIHTYRDFLDTWKTVRKAGFENVNIDLISAIPGQTVPGWERTLRTAAELGPEHISAYSLIVEDGTPFYACFEEEAPGLHLPPLPDEDTEREIYKSTEKILAEYGYHRYEISNYAKEGCECRHNLGYWERREYLGLGLGASSLIGGYRYRNTSDMGLYLRYAGDHAGADMYEERERLSVEDQMEEFMFLGLRKTEGISTDTFRETFGKEIDKVYGPQLDKMKDLGLLIVSDGRVRLTERGVDVSNYVFCEFLF